MKRVFEAQNPTEAFFVQGLLEAEGIAADVKGEALFTTVQGAAAIPGMRPSVWIQEETEAPRALELVARYSREAQHMEGPSWLCPECGEGHEPQFAECWHCGTARPLRDASLQE